MDDILAVKSHSQIITVMKLYANIVGRNVGSLTELSNVIIQSQGAMMACGGKTLIGQLLELLRFDYLHMTMHDNRTFVVLCMALQIVLLS